MPKGTDKPNMLILMSDQHNRQFGGCYVNEIVRTPNIDRLASDVEIRLASAAQ